ncbi:hypothetical protein [Pseudofrankia sp. BMG5.37]|uniref:hypothetical protein n=1 Tax=Pseudofrankia sp. BMG5.37 TaxID=3050035 RepID=UPI0028958CC7|nr:hypothetical protein [Pseudofrankia sp. BMG5.37]MDT3446198.1 hypothetical protein [Pseudofrankia sp. BMG5.37]
MAEWPASLEKVATWTSKTVLAADDTGSAAAMLALTPTDDGRMRVDPVPLPPRSSREAFGYGYGYGGGTPSSTHRAILRCALGDIPDLGKVHELIGEYRDEAPVSQLWAAISTTHGPLRLPWPRVQLWAHTDRATSRLDAAGRREQERPADAGL